MPLEEWREAVKVLADEADESDIGPGLQLDPELVSGWGWGHSRACTLACCLYNNHAHGRGRQTRPDDIFEKQFLSSLSLWGVFTPQLLWIFTTSFFFFFSEPLTLFHNKKCTRTHIIESFTLVQRAWSGPSQYLRREPSRLCQWL